MRRPVALIAMLLAGCASMEPHYVRPESAVPPSWPVGDPYLRQSEAALPTVTYKDIFRDRAAADADRAGAGQQPRSDGRRGQYRRGARAISHPARPTPSRSRRERRRHRFEAAKAAPGLPRTIAAGRGHAELRARPVRPDPLADQSPAQPLSRHGGGRAGDAADLGRRRCRRLAGLCGRCQPACRSPRARRQARKRACA